MKKQLTANFIFSLLGIIALVNLSFAFANTLLPTNAAYPGGIAVVPLTIKSRSIPKVFYQRHRVTVIKNDNHWIALVGIPLTIKPGQQTLTIKPGFGRFRKQLFTIVEKTYPLRHITIKDKSKVTPNPTLARKIKLQGREARRILQTWTNTTNVATDFILPVKGRLSSPFGVRRIYNKIKPGRHTGLDIAAPSGTPIVAAANGYVIASKDFVLTGNTLYVDHGQGLITFYCHMRTTAVKPGQFVQQGQKLGTVGATGRVTGPHLHWGLSLNGTKVNPLLLVAKKR